MQLIVTGGAGFVGSAVCRHLIAATDWPVVNFDKLTYAASPAALSSIAGHPRYRFVQGDIADRESVRALFADVRPDAVLNLAAETHVDRSIDSAAEFIRSNIDGSFVLLEEARRYFETLPETARARFRFHHVSTDEVFGSLGESGRFDGASRYDPSSPYAASKAASDHLVRAWGRTYGLPILISNSSNTYGPYQFPEKLIPLITLRALQGETLPVYGTGDNIRDWLHVEDHAAALKLVLERAEPGSTTTIGASAERRNIDLVAAISDLVDELAGPLPSGPRRQLIQFVADRPGHDARYAMDASALRQQLGWTPRYSFEEGLRQTVGWYLANEAWWRPLLARGRALERKGLRPRG